MIFARQGGGRRKADALQGRQRSIAKIRPQRLSTFSQELVLYRYADRLRRCSRLYCYRG